jgi:hypothetical protein
MVFRIKQRCTKYATIYTTTKRKEYDKRKNHKRRNLHVIYIASNNFRHPVTETFTTRHPTTLHYTSQYFTQLYSTSLHLSTLHLLPFKLHPTPRHYTCEHFTSSHLNFTNCTSFHFTTLVNTSIPPF